MQGYDYRYDSDYIGRRRVARPRSPSPPPRPPRAEPRSPSYSPPPQRRYIPPRDERRRRRIRNAERRLDFSQELQNRIEQLEHEVEMEKSNHAETNQTLDNASKAATWYQEECRILQTKVDELEDKNKRLTKEKQDLEEDLSQIERKMRVKRILGESS